MPFGVISGADFPEINLSEQKIPSQVDKTGLFAKQTQ